MSKKKKHIKPFPESELHNPAANSSTINSTRLLGLIVAVIAFLLYFNTINHNYALDDVACIEQNKFTKQGIAGIPILLKTFYWQGYWDQNSGIYRPLSMITFAVEYQFFKGNPHISHLISVLLYTLTAFLLFYVLRKIFHLQSALLSFIATLLFVAHPVHTEVVANVKSRDELLCFVFFLLTLLNIFNYLKSNSTKDLGFALVCYFLSLFSKEGALVYLGIVPLTIYFFTDTSTKKTIRISLQLATVALGFIILHEYVIAHGPPTHPYSYHDNSLVAAPNIASRVATALLIMGYYLKLLVLPLPLSYDYSYNQFPATGLGNPLVLLSLAIHIGLLVYAIKNFKQKNIYAFSMLFYFIGMSMVSNVFFLIGATMGDRLLYAPSLALCIALAWFIVNYKKTDLKEKSFTSLADFFKTYAKPLLVAITIAIGFSFKTVTRNKNWEDNFTLFSTDVKASPGSARTHYNYGTELLFRKAFPENDSIKKNKILDKVIFELETATKIDSIDPGAYLNLSTAYYQRKNYTEAVRTATLAAKYNPNDGKAYLTLGNSLYRIGKYDLAIENLKVAVAKKFGEEEAYNTMGVSYFGKKDFLSAIGAFKKSIEINANGTGALNNLGSAYGLTGNYNMAIETFLKSYAVDPNDKSTVYYLALTYQNMNDTANARVFTQKYNALNTVGK